MLARRWIAVPVVAIGFFAGGAVSSPSAAAQSSAESSVTRETSLEALVVTKINEVRAARGLHRLTRSSALTRSAVSHSRAMATEGFFTHESSNGMPFWRRVEKSYGPREQGWTVGENLAMFGGSAPTAAAIVAAWMASPPHRANLLRPIFREEGVGIIFNPTAGGVFGGDPTWVVTLDIGRR